MNYQCCEQLTKMRLSVMRDEYRRQEELPASMELSFDERFSMIVQAQYDNRKHNRAKNSLGKASLRESCATLSELDFSPERNLSKRHIAQLAGMSWIKEGKGILITGATGTGKTFLLCAFAHDACNMGYTARYYRLTELMQIMAQSREPGKYAKVLAEMGKPDILILDEFGSRQYDNEFSSDLLEIMEERYHNQKSVLIGSQLPVRLWTDSFSNRDAAEGFMDRITNVCYRIELKGPSRRRRMSAEEIWGPDGRPPQNEGLNAPSNPSYDGTRTNDYEDNQGINLE